MLAATCALLALAWASAPASAIQFAPPEPHSPNADAIHSTYWVMLVISVVLVVIINVGLVLAVTRFRERRGREPSRFVAGRGALRPVLAGLGVLALAIFIFGVVETEDARTVEPSGPNGLGGAPTAQVGVKGLESLPAIESDSSETGAEASDPSAPTDTSPLQINAIAQQWLWRFEYPGHTPSSSLFSYGELVVPVDTTVILNITSTDVNHSWWIPALGGQVQASPGEISQTWFRADEVGRYEGRSTVFSGTSFPAMRAWVRVVTVPEYQAYVADLAQQLKEAQEYVTENEPAPDAG